MAAPPTVPTMPARTPAVPRTAPARDAAARLDRYAGLVADWDAFAAAMCAPKPACATVNRNRVRPAQLAALCRAEGMAAAPLAWTDQALAAPPAARPGLWWPHQAGLFQLQEEASLLPVHLLAPRPGEAILDLCAAPGGKAAQIAMTLDAAGTVVANDKNAGRLAAVRDKMKRLGLLNMTTTVHDGADFPLAAGPFDRVLVDAPCSAEGTQFAQGAAFVAQSKEFAHKLQGQQRALLRRALRLVRPGGRVVYATCSLAPEENEAVLDAVLAERDDVTVRAMALPGLAADAGVPEWQGRRFHPGVTNAVRLWPHRTGTGGFFAAVLERAGGPDPDAGRRATPDPANAGPDAEMGDHLATLRRHFGLPADALAGLRFHARGDEIHATGAGHAPWPRPRPQSSGIPFIKRAGHWPKPTTAAAMRLGDRARRSVVDLDRDQRDAYQRRATIVPDVEQLRTCPARGYVLVRYAGFALGAAFLARREPPELRSEFPRIWVPESDRRTDTTPTRSPA